MTWKLQFKPKALKEIKKLDRTVQTRVMRYLIERISIDPKASGEALVGNLKGLWRYRVGDYRIIADIQAENITVLVVRVAKRSDVYE